ncbi:MAG: hypothetical protein HY925_11135 [Elusimicrobia bacterium]|nr:hypothetical protein [Elusimicrobiota bacterium]
MNDIIKKAQQFAIQFSCRIPLRMELKASEKEAIKAYLQDLDGTHFQIFDASVQVPPGQPAPLFHVFRQYNMSGGAIATGPSFFLGVDAVTVHYLIKAGENTFHSAPSLQMSELNKRTETIFFKVAEIVKGLRFARAGKIFEVVIPYTAADKPALLKRIFSENLSDISEAQLVCNRIVQASFGKKVNVHAQQVFQQMRPEDNFNLATKIDINNRDLQNSMEPRDVAAVWKEADELIASTLEGVIL